MCLLCYMYYTTRHRTLKAVTSNVMSATDFAQYAMQRMASLRRRTVQTPTMGAPAHKTSRQNSSRCGSASPTSITFPCLAHLPVKRTGGASHRTPCSALPSACKARWDERLGFRSRSCSTQKPGSEASGWASLGKGYKALECST